MMVPVSFIGAQGFRRNVSALAGVNEDAEAALARGGVRNVDCKFVPYTGPFGGGTNVCDIGDGQGYAYGAELVAQPGGVDILKRDSERAKADLERMKQEEAAGRVIVTGSPLPSVTIPSDRPSNPPASTTPPVSTTPPAPTNTRGSGSPAQTQQPSTSPTTVQGAKDKKEASTTFEVTKEGLTLGEIQLSWAVVGLGAVAFYFLTNKGGR